MSTQVIERPATVSFSKNEIRYGFHTNNIKPAGLHVQVQLWSKIFKGSSNLNWKCLQAGDPYVDANLFIKVNGTLVVMEFFPNTGNIALNAGDVVEIFLPVLDAWPLTGSPYSKLIVKEELSVLFNDFSTSPIEADWLTYTFTAEAGKNYAAIGYADVESNTPHTTDLDVPESNSYTLQRTEYLKPNPDGTTYLYINDRIDSLLKYILPEVQYVVANASRQTASFYIRYREVTDANPDPSWIETEISQKRIAIKGGVEKQIASRNNYFLYRESLKSFFTWMPNNRFVFIDERVYLTILVPQGTHKLVTTVKKMDGGTATSIQNIDCTQGILFHLNVSPGILDISGIAGGDSVQYYEVKVTLADNTILYNSHRFYIEYRPSYNSYDLMFHNSLGGVDTVRVRGEVSWEIERDYQEAEGGFNLNDAQSTEKGGEITDIGITKRDKYIGDIGFLRTADGKMQQLQEAMVDLLVSPSIYQYLNSRWVRIRNMQRNMSLRNGQDKKFSFPIEWQLPFNNTVFTPKTVNLGISPDTETYS